MWLACAKFKRRRQRYLFIINFVMGQSQSQIERNKARPIQAHKIFGLIFFQRKYDAVKQSDEKLSEFFWQQKFGKHATQAFRTFRDVEYPALSEEVKAKHQNKPTKAWNDEYKAIEEKRWNASFDPEKKRQEIAEYVRLLPTQKKQGMQDLHATYNDAQYMFDFLAKHACQSVNDITVMSEKNDFLHLYSKSKPTYEGDFYEQIFDWNINKEGLADERERLVKRLTKEKPIANESWDKFSKRLMQPSKYAAKHESRKWKRGKTLQMVKWFKDEYTKDERTGNKKEEREQRAFELCYKDQTIKDKNLTLASIKQNKVDMDGVLPEALAEFDKMDTVETTYVDTKSGEDRRAGPNKDLSSADVEGPEVRFKMEDYWLKSEYERARSIFRKQHPLIFLKEDQPAWKKIQSNWVFQCLTPHEKKLYLQNRMPKYAKPTKENYVNYLEMIRHHHDKHETEEVLSIQTFACHGVVDRGCQSVLINKIDYDENFYKMLRVEFLIRNMAKDMPRAYFLTLFACCRESYVKGAKQFTEMDNQEDKVAEEQATRGSGAQASSTDPANFTFLFGCNPAEGVNADTQFVKAFVTHCIDQFRPEDGTLMLPEDLGVIDAAKDNVNFESTSCNIGRSLRLKRYDNKVGPKMLFIIKRNYKADICDRTKGILNFFVNDMGFDREKEVFIMTENEARTYEECLGQSSVFKRHHKLLQKRLLDFAKNIFQDDNEHACSSEQQLFTVFLNESDQEDVKDFVINRNPELGLNILHPDSQLLGNDKDKNKYECDEIAKIYARTLTEKLKSLNELQLTNLQTFFHHTMGVVTFTTRSNKFKHGTGQFNYVFNLKERTDRTVKFKFDYLEKHPLRKFVVNRHTLGVAINDPYAENWHPPLKQKDRYREQDFANNALVVMELIDYNDTFTHKEIKARIKRPKDPIHRKKFLFAYAFYRGDNGKDVQANRQASFENKDGWVEVKGIDKQGQEFSLTEKDEVVSLKKLYHDTKNRRLYFQIILRKQTHAWIGTLDYSQWKPREKKPLQCMKNKQARQEWVQKTAQPQQQGLVINMVPMQIIDLSIQRDPTDEDEDETSLPFRAWPTEMEFNFYDQIQKEKTNTFLVETRSRKQIDFVKFKVKQALMKRCCTNFDENQALETWKEFMEETDDDIRGMMQRIDREFKVVVKHKNLNIIAHRDFTDHQLRFFVFNNRLLVNGKQSEIEIEVWKWIETNVNEPGKIERVEHKVDVIPRRQCPTQPNFQAFKQKQEEAAFKKFEQEQKEKIGNLFDMAKHLREDDKRMYFLSHMKTEDYQKKFEEEKKDADEKWMKERNKRLAKKKRYKQGAFERGETDYETYYEKKPWGDEVTEREEKKMQQCKQDKTVYIPPDDVYEKFETKRQAGTVRRIFLRYLIQNDEGRQDFYVRRIMNFSGEREDTEFWLKQPHVFYQATDTPERLIFASSSRGNFVFDLKMVRDKLILYTPEEKKAGNAFQWQKVPFAHRLDMIEPEHVSLLQHKKEAKWFKTIRCDLEGLFKKGKDTQLITLPKIVLFPNNNLPEFEKSTDDYKKAAMEVLRAEQEKKEKDKRDAEREKAEQKARDKKKARNEGGTQTQEDHQQDCKCSYCKNNPDKVATMVTTSMQAGGRILDDRYVEYGDKNVEDELPPRRLKFLFAVAQDSISIVNYTDDYRPGQEFLLAKLNAKSEYDAIEDAFITYQKRKKRITLHYFERIFEYNSKLKQSTYNQYELSEDFLSMLFNTEELMPHEQSSMIKRIKTIKTPPDRVIDLTVKERAIMDLVKELGLDTNDLENQIQERKQEERLREENNQLIKNFRKNMEELLAKAQETVSKA